MNQHDSIDQKRANGDPYWTHPERVADTIDSLYGVASHALRSAAPAHDIYEDIPDMTFEILVENIGFSAAVLVLEVSNVFTRENYPNMNNAKRKQNEAIRLGRISHDAKILKLSDIIDNLSDIDQAKPAYADKYRSQKRTVLQEMIKNEPTIGHTLIFQEAARLAKLEPNSFSYPR